MPAKVEDQVVHGRSLRRHETAKAFRGDLSLRLRALCKPPNLDQKGPKAPGQ